MIRLTNFTGLSDCEHEVTEVSSGIRLTLTYNIYSGADDQTGKPFSSIVDPGCFKIYNAFVEAKARAESQGNNRSDSSGSKKQKQKMRETKVVGFPRDVYPFMMKQDRKTPNEMAKMLKGADAMLLAAAKAAGLNAQVRPIWMFDESEEDWEGNRIPKTRMCVGRIFGDLFVTTNCYEDCDVADVFPIMHASRVKLKGSSTGRLEVLLLHTVINPAQRSAIVQLPFSSRSEFVLQTTFRSVQA